MSLVSTQEESSPSIESPNSSDAGQIQNSLEERRSTTSGALAPTGHTVQTETFEGPFDLLLHLILKDEVDLYEVSLHDIVDAYLEELEAMTYCDLEVATEFLLIAATLIDLKVRRMLPSNNDFDLDDELALWEERDLLLSRLLECKTFKDAAKTLEGLAEAAKDTFARISGIESQFLDLTPDLLAGVTAEHLKRSFLRLVAPRPEPTVSLHHMSQIKLTVSDTMASLAERLPRLGRINFRFLTADCGERIEIVVHFLAVLEMFKQGALEIEQSVSFGELSIEWVGDGADVDRILANADSYEG